MENNIVIDKEYSNIFLENQSNLSLDLGKFRKSTFLLRLEGFWNSCKDRDKIMEFIRKELYE